MDKLTKQDIVWVIQQAIAYHETGECLYFVDKAKEIIEYMTGKPHELAPYAPHCTCEFVARDYPKLDYKNCPVHNLETGNW